MAEHSELYKKGHKYSPLKTQILFGSYKELQNTPLMATRAERHCHATLYVNGPRLVNIEDLRVLRTGAQQPAQQRRSHGTTQLPNIRPVCHGNIHRKGL